MKPVRLSLGLQEPDPTQPSEDGGRLIHIDVEFSGDGGSSPIALLPKQEKQRLDVRDAMEMLLD